MIRSLLNSIILIIFIFPLCILAQTNGNITVGTTITAAANSNPWLSPSGDFAFGFQQLQNISDLFVLCIWFHRIPDRTIVWFERNSYPVPSGSMLQLTARRGLLLRDSTGRSLWNTNGFADEVAYGYMNDTGNFILASSNSASLWQSFSNPTDTILPNQTLAIDGMLVSRMTQTNFSEGRFYARMLETGNFVFNTGSVPSKTGFDDEYYNSQTSDVNASNSGYQVLFDDRGSISIVSRNGQEVVLSPRSIPSATDNYYRATIDFDGVFTQYYHPRSFSGNPVWTAVGSWPDNICLSIDGGTGSGACGYNSICTLQNQRPVCQCPQGFYLADPSNLYGDCWPKFKPNCDNGENGSVFQLLPISDTDWPMNDYEQISPSTKVDVYSFGVLLLEIISCRKSVVNLENFEDHENPILTDWVWDCFQEKKLDSLVDDDMEAISDRKGMERFVMVGLWCIQEDVSLRPTMRKATQMLEGIVEVATPPCPSPFSMTT